MMCARTLTAVLALCGTLAAGGASAADVARPAFAMNTSYVVRGSSLDVPAIDLTPGARYVVTTDTGVFTSTGTTSVTVTADTDGRADTWLSGTDQAPATQRGLALRLEDANGETVLDSLSLQFSAPGVWTTLCPSRSATVEGGGFPDGKFSISSPYATFPSGTVDVVGGQFSTTASGARDLPAEVPIEVAESTDPSVHFTDTVKRPLARAMRSDQANWTPWQQHYTADCLAPGETMTPANSTKTGNGVPTTVDRHGHALLTLDLHPAGRTQLTGAVTFVGSISKQRVRIGAEVLATTLVGGQQLGTNSSDAAGTGHILAAASSVVSAGGGANYIFVGSCNPGIARIFPDNSSGRSWSLYPGYRPGDCTLALERDGDLVLRSAAGSSTWSSGTRGTKTGNRLVMRTDGRAVIYTGTDAEIWATPAGKIVAPATSVLRAGASLSRGESKSRGNVRFGLSQHGSVFVSRAGRTVWIEHTAGRGGTQLSLTVNGNLVLRTAHGRTVWSTRSRGTAAHLSVTPAGDVGIFAAHGARLWHTDTDI